MGLNRLRAGTLRGGQAGGGDPQPRPAAESVAKPGRGEGPKSGLEKRVGRRFRYENGGREPGGEGLPMSTAAGLVIASIVLGVFALLCCLVLRVGGGRARTNVTP